MATVRMKIANLRVDDISRGAVVVLSDEAETRELPIFIGPAEASAIAVALGGFTLPRPMTHDLLANVISQLQGQLDRVVVTELKGGTFFARLYVTVHDGTVDIDARPSDSIALALRLDAPIFVDEEVLEKGEVTAEDRERAEKDHWRTFLESLDDDDFSGSPS